MNKKTSYSVLLNMFLGSAFAGTMGAVDVNENFSGLYLGLGAGYATLFSKDNLLGTVPFRQDNMSTAAVEFEGHVGYGKFVADKIYFGGKASIYYTPLELLNYRVITKVKGGSLTTGYYEPQVTVNPIYNIDAVLGYEIAPNILPFVEGGVSFSNVYTNAVLVESHTTIPGATSSYVDRYQNNASGFKTTYNVGIGANYQPKKNWLLSTELVYHYLGKYSNTYVNGPDIDARNRTYQLVSLFAGVSYVFPML